MVSRVLVLASIFALFLASSLPATAVSGGESDVTIKTFQFRPFTYFCDRHHSMRGEIRVK